MFLEAGSPRLGGYICIEFTLLHGWWKNRRASRCEKAKEIELPNSLLHSLKRQHRSINEAPLPSYPISECIEDLPRESKPHKEFQIGTNPIQIIAFYLSSLKTKVLLNI